MAALLGCKVEISMALVDFSFFYIEEKSSQIPSFNIPTLFSIILLPLPLLLALSYILLPGG